LYAVFIDLSKAFDSINHAKLWKRLAEIGLSSKFINYIKLLYSNLRTKVRTRAGESSFFKFKKGVMQGESLSPKLFTLFIDKLVEIMHKSDIPAISIGKLLVHMLLYADDIVLMATNSIDLQAKIDIVRKFFAGFDLIVNLSKTKCVVFNRNKNKKSEVPVLYWGNEIIEVVES